MFEKRWNHFTGEKYHFNTPCWWICTHTSCCLCNQRCSKALIQSALSPSEGWRTTYSLWLNDHPHRQADRHTDRQTGKKHCLINKLAYVVFSLEIRGIFFFYVSVCPWTAHLVSYLSMMLILKSIINELTTILINNYVNTWIAANSKAKPWV